jgi:hypothetical protein
VAGCCEHDNELSVSKKAGNFLPSCVTVSFPRRVLFYGLSFSKMVRYKINGKLSL